MYKWGVEWFDWGILYDVYYMMYEMQNGVVTQTAIQAARDFSDLGISGWRFVYV